MAEDPKQQPSWIRLSGLGIEMVAALGLFLLVGYWWDRHFGTSWGMVIWGVVGLVGIMYNLIRQSLRAFKDAGDGQRTTDSDEKR
jgi:F0F1-type ATP synthase assembly protein I